MDKKTVGIIAVVIAVILAIVAIFALKGNKEPIEEKQPNQEVSVNNTDTNNVDTSKKEVEIEEGKVTDTLKPQIIIPEGEIPSQDSVIEYKPEPVDWEEPPVYTTYNPEADTNSDGHVDKAEWEVWVQNHPEDLNQDLIIEDEEKQVYEETDEGDDARLEFKPISDPEEYKQVQEEKFEEEQKELAEEYNKANKEIEEKWDEEHSGEGRTLEEILADHPDWYLDDNGNLIITDDNFTTWESLQEP